MSLESEQLLGRATVGKSKNPARSTWRREKHPQAALEVSSAWSWHRPPREWFWDVLTPPVLRTPGMVTFTGGGVKEEGRTVSWGPSLVHRIQPTDPVTLQRCHSLCGLIAFRLQALFIAWNILFQLSVSAWPISHPQGLGVGPPLPESLPGLDVSTLVPRILGSSLPQEILHQAVIAFHAFVSPSPGCEPLGAGAPTHCCLSQHLPRARHRGGAGRAEMWFRPSDLSSVFRAQGSSELHQELLYHVETDIQTPYLRCLGSSPGPTAPLTSCPMAIIVLSTSSFPPGAFPWTSPPAAFSQGTSYI